ncbi:MAG: DUF4347 domain-containing protein [Oscillatoriaceae cyanobacterium Prado104]|nr:DUF4347 domain-containing protein [Oscillatoriaceae cyanobacterium Prado104]
MFNSPSFTFTCDRIPLDTTLLRNPLGEGTELALTPLPLMGQSSKITQLAFIDAGLPDYQTLVDGLQADMTVYVLDPAGDELIQISQVLAGYSNLTSVQIFSHGSDGALQLGNTSLNTDNLLGYAGVLQSWAGALTEDADILLYGCDVAEDTVGQNFVHQLATVTGADVAASSDLTGSQALGGNWNLEFSTGSIEASGALSDSAQATYQNVLATFNVNTTDDVVNGNDRFLSLREAIVAANTNQDSSDTILLKAGTYNLSLTGTPDNTAAAGDLDITSGTISIQGAGAATTTIDAKQIDRVFQVLDGATLNLNGLTITGGQRLDNSGGGIANSGTLNVSNSTLSGNSADCGGGISNATGGTLSVSHSTLNGNSASKSGGGICTTGRVRVSNSTLNGNSAEFGGGISIGEGGVVTASNSTLRDNWANRGGGIGNNGTLTLSNSTLSGNSAKLSATNPDSGIGGGILNGKGPSGAGTVRVSNSILSGNNAENYGGGIFNHYGTLALNNSTLSGNSAGAGGGGIGNYNGTLTLNNSTLRGNSVLIPYYGQNNGRPYGVGGGLLILRDDPSAATTAIVNNSPIYSNTATQGAGIGNYNGTLTLNHSTLSGNKATASGGGIYNDGTLTLSHSTVSRNSAVLYGGGIYNDGTLNLSHSPIAGNTASQGGADIYYAS